jgi:hypothetical protein
MSTIHPVRSPRGDSRHSSVYATGSARLAAYLAAGVGASMVGTPDAEAAVVAIDLTNLGSGINVTGANGGMGGTTFRSIPNWLGSGTGTLKLYNGYASGPTSLRGLDGASGLYFAVGPNTGQAFPLNLAGNATINASLTFSDTGLETMFTTGSYSTSSFGANSYMGFRFASGIDWNYGYLEVTWNASTATFQILSGAYESTVNTAILAGATPVPAPSALALLALGGGAFRRARARAA